MKFFLVFFAFLKIFADQTLYVGGKDPITQTGCVFVIDTKTNAVKRKINTRFIPLSLALSPDGKTLYAGLELLSSALIKIDLSTDASENVNGADLVFPYNMEIDPKNQFLYALNSALDSVSIVDIAKNTYIKSITVGDNPLSLAITRDGKSIYTANAKSNDVSLIASSSNTVSIPSILVGSQPAGIALSPDQRFAYVTNSGSNDLSVISLKTQQVVIPSIPVGTQPSGLAFSPTGKNLYVANTESNTVSVLDTSVNTVVQTIPVGVFPTKIVVEDSGRFCYGLDSQGESVFVIDLFRQTTSYIEGIATPVSIAISHQPSLVQSLEKWSPIKYQKAL